MNMKSLAFIFLLLTNISISAQTKPLSVRMAETAMNRVWPNSPNGKGIPPMWFYDFGVEANLCVAAHLAHVAFAGRKNEHGDIVPRFNITLASQIDEETCRRVNLGFLDYHEFRLTDYEGNPDTLIVERAGRDLYLVQQQ